jgi:phosphoglycerol transferase MdoB-like AlkP superfamily enzyme
MTAYLWGLFTLPLGIIALLLAAVIYRRVREWYLGLPLTSWFGMTLVLIGLKLVNRRHMESLKGQGRIWISPRVKGFELEDGRL